MIGTVAVGTDGSETAGKAFALALELAERYGAGLVVLSAFGGRSGAASAPRLSASPGAGWASNAAEQVERILAVAEETAAERGIECTTAMAEGDPGEVLVELAERHGAARARERPEHRDAQGVVLGPPGEDRLAPAVGGAAEGALARRVLAMVHGDRRTERC